MKFTLIASLLFALLFTANVYIYLQNLQILKGIDKADNACEQDLAATEQGYLKQINELSLQLNDQSNSGVTKNAHISSNLDRTASYGHLFGAVSHKYEFLLHTVKLSIDDKQELLSYLIEREKLSAVTLKSLVATNEKERENFALRLKSTEESIKVILRDPVDYQRYEYLKNRSL